MREVRDGVVLTSPAEELMVAPRDANEKPLDVTEGFEASADVRFSEKPLVDVFEESLPKLVDKPDPNPVNAAPNGDADVEEFADEPPKLLKIDAVVVVSVVLLSELKGLDADVVIEKGFVLSLAFANNDEKFGAPVPAFTETTAESSFFPGSLKV